MVQKVGSLTEAGNTTQNRVIQRDWVNAGNAKTATSSTQTKLALGQNDAVVIWMKKGTSTDAEVDLVVNAEEEW
jgi:hypothetical protein